MLGGYIYYQALLERRRRSVVRGEELRLQREADLKQLDDVKARLMEAEGRQVKLFPMYGGWRRRWKDTLLGRRVEYIIYIHCEGVKKRVPVNNTSTV